MAAHIAEESSWAKFYSLKFWTRWVAAQQIPMIWANSMFYYKDESGKLGFFPVVASNFLLEKCLQWWCMYTLVLKYVHSGAESPPSDKKSPIKCHTFPKLSRRHCSDVAKMLLCRTCLTCANNYVWCLHWTFQIVLPTSGGCEGIISSEWSGHQNMEVSSLGCMVEMVTMRTPMLMMRWLVKNRLMTGQICERRATHAPTHPISHLPLKAPMAPLGPHCMPIAQFRFNWNFSCVTIHNVEYTRAIVGVYKCNCCNQGTPNLVSLKSLQPKLQSVWVHLCLWCTQLHHKVFARVTFQKHHTQKCLLVAHAMMASNCARHVVQYNTRPCKHGIFEQALRHPGQPIEGGC